MANGAAFRVAPGQPRGSTDGRGSADGSRHWRPALRSGRSFPRLQQVGALLDRARRQPLRRHRGLPAGAGAAGRGGGGRHLLARPAGRPGGAPAPGQPGARHEPAPAPAPALRAPVRRDREPGPVRRGAGIGGGPDRVAFPQRRGALPERRARRQAQPGAHPISVVSRRRQAAHGPAHGGPAPSSTSSASSRGRSPASSISASTASAWTASSRARWSR